MTRQVWQAQARENLEAVRALLCSLELALEEHGPEWRSAGDLEAIQAREEARDALEIEETWWESFAPRGEQW